MGLVDSSFGPLRDDDGNQFATAFVRDCTVSTEGYDDESFVDVVERHLRQVEIFCTAANERRIQFKFDKRRLAWSRIPLLGFVVGDVARAVQQGKAQALNDWPDPTCLEDVVSFRAFAN